MKKLKSILALMIAMVIMCLSVLPAFASDIAKEKLNELRFKIYDVAEEFNMKVDGSYYPVEGEVFLNYTDETYNNLNSVLNVASEYIIDNETGIYFGEIEPIDEMDELMADIDKAYTEMVLEKRELEYLVSYCQSEINNNYYSDEVWNDFLEELEAAKTTLADKTIVDTRVTDAFWSLFESYNKLCLYNDVLGDVDGNGEITIMDVTSIQRYLAKLTDFNSSQKFVGWVSTSYSGEMNITCATEIQKYMAQLTDNTNWCYYYKELKNSFNIRDIKSNQLFYDEYSGHWC